MDPLKIIIDLVKRGDGAKLTEEELKQLSAAVDKLSVDMAENDQIVRRTAADYKHLEDSQEKAAASSKMMAGAVAGIAAAFAANQIKGLITDSLHYATATLNVADALGLTYDKYQAITYAAMQNGVTTEQVGAALRQLATQSQTNAKMLNGLGIATTDAEGKQLSLSDQLDAVAERLSGVQDGGERTAIAMRALGESGTKLVPILANGAAGLRSFEEQARKSGQVMDREMVRNLAEADQQLANFSRKMTIYSGNLATVFTSQFLTHDLPIVVGNLLGMDETVQGLIKDSQALANSNLSDTLAGQAQAYDAVADAARRAAEAQQQSAKDDERLNAMIKRASERIAQSKVDGMTPEQKQQAEVGARQAQYNQEVSFAQGAVGITQETKDQVIKTLTDELNADIAAIGKKYEEQIKAARRSQAEQNILDQFSTQAGDYAGLAQAIGRSAQGQSNPALFEAARQLNEAAKAAQEDGTTKQEFSTILEAMKELTNQLKQAKIESKRAADLANQALAAAKNLRN